MVIPVEVLGAHVGPVLCHNGAIVLQAAHHVRRLAAMHCSDEVVSMHLRSCSSPFLPAQCNAVQMKYVAVRAHSSDQYPLVLRLLPPLPRQGGLCAPTVCATGPQNFHPRSHGSTTAVAPGAAPNAFQLAILVAEPHLDPERKVELIVAIEGRQCWHHIQPVYQAVLPSHRQLERLRTHHTTYF